METDDDFMVDGSDHSGKAAIAIVDAQVTVTVDCMTCGRMVLGPFLIQHLRSIGDILVNVANQLGAPEAHAEVTQHYEGNDKSVVEEGMKIFNEMPIHDTKTKKSAWGWFKEKIH